MISACIEHSNILDPLEVNCLTHLIELESCGIPMLLIWVMIPQDILDYAYLQNLHTGNKQTCLEH